MAAKAGRQGSPHRTQGLPSQLAAMFRRSNPTSGGLSVSATVAPSRASASPTSPTPAPSSRHRRPIVGIKPLLVMSARRWELLSQGHSTSKVSVRHSAVRM